MCFKATLSIRNLYIHIIYFHHTYRCYKILNLVSYSSPSQKRSMSRSLPASEEEMLMIPHVTKANFDKYGSALLDVTQRYAAQKMSKLLGNKTDQVGDRCCSYSKIIQEDDMVDNLRTTFMYLVNFCTYSECRVCYSCWYQNHRGILYSCCMTYDVHQDTREEV